MIDAGIHKQLPVRPGNLAVVTNHQRHEYGALRRASQYVFYMLPDSFTPARYQCGWLPDQRLQPAHAGFADNRTTGTNLVGQAPRSIIKSMRVSRRMWPL